MMPSTVIWEMEFDQFITEATRMVHRMSAFMPGTMAENIGDYKLDLRHHNDEGITVKFFK